MKKITRNSIVAIILLLIFLIVYIFLNSDFKEVFYSVEKFKNFLLDFGIWTPIIFFIIQLLQVIIAPIPGNITGLVSGGLYGVFIGFILSGSATVLGSIIAFKLARRFGKPIIYKLAKKETINKYEKMSKDRYSIGLFSLFLLPFFPDDILCFIAGISPMKFSVFVIMLIFGRMPGVLITTLIGAGAVNNNILQLSIGLGIYFILVVLLFKFNHKFHDLID